VHPWVFAACNDENGINAATYEALASRFTLPDLINLLEMRGVRASWTHAELRNQDYVREEERQRKAQLG
jgi:hypothetical protein